MGIFSRSPSCPVVYLPLGPVLSSLPEGRSRLALLRILKYGDLGAGGRQSDAGRRTSIAVTQHETRTGNRDIKNTFNRTSLVHRIWWYFQQYSIGRGGSVHQLMSLQCLWQGGSRFESRRRQDFRHSSSTTRSNSVAIWRRILAAKINFFQVTQVRTSFEVWVGGFVVGEFEVQTLWSVGYWRAGRG